MARLTYFVGSSDISAAIAANPTSGTMTGSSTEYRAVYGDLVDIYRGDLLSWSGSWKLGLYEYADKWLAGTLTRFEVTHKGTTLYRLEDISVPTNSLNSITETTYYEFLHTERNSYKHPLNVGLSGSDTVFGSPFNDRLYAKEGDDSISAGGGDDTLLEDSGNDTYDGGTGMDTLDQGEYRKADVRLTQRPGGGWQIFDIPLQQTDTTTNVEYIKFSDGTLDLLNLALGAPVAPDARGTQVFRFAKVDSGQYFYTGNLAERNQIMANMPNFRYEGVVYNAQDNWVTGYTPVYRFANQANGGYFYTASVAERDSVISSFPNLRYEGATFYVPVAAGADTVPVFRLANLKTGGYLFTTSSAEQSFALSLGTWRSEGIAFQAPRNVALASDSDSIASSSDAAAVGDLAPALVDLAGADSSWLL